MIYLLFTIQLSRILGHHLLTEVSLYRSYFMCLTMTIGSGDLSYEEFHSISVAVCSSWERLAIHLEVSSDSIESIKSVTKDPVECCFRMLSAWYDTGSSSRDKLAAVLTEVGKGRLARSLH